MTETIISEIKPKRKIKYVVVLIVGLLILGLAIYLSCIAHLVTEGCINLGFGFVPVAKFRFYIWDFISQYFLGIKDICVIDTRLLLIDSCNNFYVYIFYIDLYLISLLMIGYGGRGLIKKS